MRAERPERVLVGAQLAEVEPVAVDVVDVAELARVGDLLQLDHARVVLEQVADHQDLARALGRGRDLLGVGDGLRQRLLDEAVLAGLERLEREVGVGRHRRGDDHRVERVVGEQIVDVAGGRPDAREAARVQRSSASCEPSQSQRSSAPGSRSKLRARFGPQ